MADLEKISVIEDNYSNQLKIKGSQFLGHALRISSSEEAESELEKIKKEHYNAAHHCYAYKINNGYIKYSDDGEPSGTAGIRILNSITTFKLTDLLVVVVRYFGGIKLGIGPLGKAYRDTAYQLLEQAKKIDLVKFEEIMIRYSYEYTSAIHFVLNRFECRKIQNKYEKTPSLTALIKPSDIKRFNKELTEKTSGNVKFSRSNEYIYLRLK